MASTKPLASSHVIPMVGIAFWVVLFLVVVGVSILLIVHVSWVAFLAFYLLVLVLACLRWGQMAQNMAIEHK